MKIFRSIQEIKAFRHESRLAEQSLGFVPTMGSLHEGHLALIQRAHEENDLTVCSIYVNPTQFNKKDDFDKYPRNYEADFELLRQFPNTHVLLPADDWMYPQEPLLKFDFGYLETIMEGKFRPGHFNGVALVLAKLFHLVQPDKTYFGQKDLQQCMVVKRLIDDLSFGIQMVICPTVREPDGLALSSRNRRLNEEQRARALLIPKLSQEMLAILVMADEETDFAEARAQIAQDLKLQGVDLEYIELVDARTLKAIDPLEDSSILAICIAAYVDDVRLIDNLIFATTLEAVDLNQLFS